MRYLFDAMFLVIDDSSYGFSIYMQMIFARKLYDPVWNDYLDDSFLWS